MVGTEATVVAVSLPSPYHAMTVRANHHRRRQDENGA